MEAPKFKEGEIVNVLCSCGCTQIMGTMIISVHPAPPPVLAMAKALGLACCPYAYLVDADSNDLYPEYMIHPIEDGDNDADDDDKTVPWDQMMEDVFPQTIKEEEPA